MSKWGSSEGNLLFSPIQFCVACLFSDGDHFSPAAAFLCAVPPQLGAARPGRPWAPGEMADWPQGCSCSSSTSGGQGGRQEAELGGPSTRCPAPPASDLLSATPRTSRAAPFCSASSCSLARHSSPLSPCQHLPLEMKTGPGHEIAHSGILGHPDFSNSLSGRGRQCCPQRPRR